MKWLNVEHFWLFGSDNIISSNVAIMYYENKVSEKWIRDLEREIQFFGNSRT